MATTTGKAARKRYGTRFAAKAAKARTRARKVFGKLPISMVAGNALEFVRKHSHSTEGERDEGRVAGKVFNPALDSKTIRRAVKAA